jgi:hypothetical protein
MEAGGIYPGISFYEKTYCFFFGRHFTKESGSKFEVRENFFSQKWSSKLIFYKEKKIEKIPLVFDFESQVFAFFDIA